MKIERLLGAVAGLCLLAAPALAQIGQVITIPGQTGFLPLAGPTSFGVIKPDGTSLSVSGGVLGVKAVTGSQVTTGLGYTPAHAGANSDITSLLGLATPLPASEGGTGAALASANQVLAGPASGGAGAPALRLLTAADIPSLSSIYLATTGGTVSGGLTINAGTGPVLQSGTLAVQRADTSNSGLAMSASGGYVYDFRERTDGTFAAPSALASGDVVYSLRVGGYDGGALENYQVGLLIKTTAAWVHGSDYEIEACLTATAPAATAVETEACFQNGLGLGSLVGKGVGTLNATGLYVNNAALSAANLSNGTTGSGAAVLSSSPVLTTPSLGTPSALTLTNATGLPLAVGTTGNLPTGRLTASIRRVITGSTDPASAATDSYIMWASTTASAKTETLPACSTATGGLTLHVKDEQGTATTYPIALTPTAGTIEGAASYSISANRGSVEITCDAAATNWNIM